MPRPLLCVCSAPCITRALLQTCHFLSNPPASLLSLPSLPFFAIHTHSSPVPLFALRPRTRTCPRKLYRYHVARQARILVHCWIHMLLFTDTSRLCASAFRNLRLPSSPGDSSLTLPLVSSYPVFSHRLRLACLPFSL
ncbi:hypothetical protein CGRA01v4_13528 [Colletotrichum graminicola]|nr:hypothetical protein CGRA01v4_13528 [Colletotrichum graminicola]